MSSRSLFVFFCLLVMAGRELSGLPVSAGNRPEASRYTCELVDRGAEGIWISVGVQVEVLFSGTMDEVLSILLDFEGSPKVFSRIESSRIRSHDGSATITVQRSGVRAFGLAFINELVFRNTLARSDEAHAILRFEMMESDGSTRAASGAWELSKVELSSGPGVSLVYTCALEVEKRFPLQLEIMKVFGKADFERTVSELGEALETSRKQVLERP